jgi:hypothetical protein
MINTLNKRALVIATFLVVSFLSVFACNVLCDFGLVSLEASHDHETSDPHGHGEGKNIHDDVSNDHHNSESNHEHDNSDSEECCEELISPFFDNLIKQKVEVFDFKNVETADFHYIFNGTKSFTVSGKRLHLLYFNKNIPPPILGDQLRILYQSFLL